LVLLFFLPSLWKFSFLPVPYCCLHYIHYYSFILCTCFHYNIFSNFSHRHLSHLFFVLSSRKSRAILCDIFQV